MGVEGQWTVFVCTGCGGCTGRHEACGAVREATPVVPCDDAAVERATLAAKEHRDPAVGWHPDTDSYAVYFYAPNTHTRREGRPVVSVTHGFESVDAAAEAIPRLQAEAVLRAAGAADAS